MIVVDDGSTDESRCIIERYGDAITAILKQNGGQASAINAGLAIARGEYVLVLDADDVLHPNAVSTAIAHFTDSYSRVAWQVTKVDRNRVPLSTNAQVSINPGFDGDAIATYIQTHSFPITPTSANLFRASTLHEVCPIPESQYRISADVYLLVATSEKGLTRVLAPRLTDYRIHGDNVFHSGSEFFSLSRIQSHILADLLASRLLEQAAVKRRPTFKARPIASRLSTALKLIATHRTGAVIPELGPMTVCMVLWEYWKGSCEAMPKKFIGVAAILAFGSLPLGFLRRLFRLRARRLSSGARSEATGHRT